ncbi:MAG: GNAT family N-acetyltransferase [Solobacterium sp.]|nr:GNAT family N-acetyltransferase [Solobacterium sp.]
MTIRSVRADTLALRAGAYYVRIQAMAKKHHISLAQEFDEQDGDSTNYVLLLEDEFPIATARMYLLNETTAMIGRVVVLPEYRHQGLGTKLMKECEAWAKELGCDTAVVESRENKTAFYEQLGYQITDDTLIEGETFRCIRMEKQIQEREGET